jgi:uncharacterized protein DUF5679
MFKRIFWLSLAAVVGWLLWRLWQQRQQDFGATTPLLAPLEPFGRHIPTPASAPAAQPAATTTPAAEPAPAPAAEPARPAATPADTGALDHAPAHAPGAPASAEHSSPDKPAGDLDQVIGYCPRCKAKRPISGAHEETTETGRRAARGTCPVCGGNMFTFLRNITQT